MRTERPTTLRCDHQPRPAITASLAPVLSWHPPRTMVPTELQLGWAVAGGASGTGAWIPCATPCRGWPGPALAREQALRWRIRLRDQAGTMSAWSDWARFETGPDPATWPRDLMRSEQPGTPLFRCRFAFAGDVVAARLAWTAVGVPAFALNGTDLLEPGLANWQNDPRSRMELFVIAVDPALFGTRNHLDCQLGGGFHERFALGRRGVRARLTIIDPSGARRDVGLDPAAWTTRPGPVISEDPYDGEHCRCDLGPRADARWLPVAIGPSPGGTTVACRCPLPGIQATHAPTRVVELDPTTRLVDFGRAVSGVARVTTRGWRGSTLVLRFGEQVDRNDRLVTSSHNLALNTDRYGIAANGPATWQPAFACRGFRACEVSCWGRWPDELTLTGLDCHDPAPALARFRCGHDGLGRLFEACRTTFAHNLVGMLRDCPQRDERLGWLGDAHAVMPSVLALCDCAATTRRWLAEIAATQDPRHHRRWAPMAPMEPRHLLGERLPPADTAGLPQADNVYTAAATLLPWQLYQATGDATVLAESLPAIAAHLAIWPERDDWPLVDASRHGDHGARPAVGGGPVPPGPLVSAAVLLMEYRCAVAMATVLAVDGSWCERRAGELAQALRERHAAAFHDPGSSQSVLAIGLHLGLCEDQSLACAALRERLARDGYRVATGIICTGMMLGALGDHGMVDEAWRLVTATGRPGWLWMLDAGPGTLHESLVDTWPCASCNQPALGVVAGWMLRDVLGLRPLPGPPGACWRLAPPTLAECPWAEGGVPTPYGPIHLRWERIGDAFTIDLDAPAAVQVVLQEDRLVREGAITPAPDYGLTLGARLTDVTTPGVVRHILLARDRPPAPSDPGPSGLPTTQDPVTGATRIVLPTTWPRAGRLRWELAGNRSGEAYGHVLDAGWRLGEEDEVLLDDVVVDGRPVADALTVARHRGVLAVREECPRDPAVRRLALDACRQLAALAAELPVGEQELGTEFAFGGSRFRLAAGPDGGARFLPTPATEADDVIEVSRIENHLRVMRTSHDRDEFLRVVRRLHLRFDH